MFKLILKLGFTQALKPTILLQIDANDTDLEFDSPNSTHAGSNSTSRTLSRERSSPVKLNFTDLRNSTHNGDDMIYEERPLTD